MVGRSSKNLLPMIRSPSRPCQALRGFGIRRGRTPRTRSAAKPDPGSNADGPGPAMLGPDLQDRATVHQSAVRFAVHLETSSADAMYAIGALHVVASSRTWATSADRKSCGEPTAHPSSI